MNPRAAGAARVTLLWLPVGAGSRVVPHTSRWWEAACALRERRPALALYHAALELDADGVAYAIEMAPAWGRLPRERGVVATGPVGARRLGRSRCFRYEVRRWPGGAIPDRGWAVGEPLVLSRDLAVARGILDRVPRVPSLTWGRAVASSRDMWNSNSLVSWLLAGVGIDASALHPPEGGRAPGWVAGLEVAARELSPVAPESPPAPPRPGRTGTARPRRGSSRPGRA